MEVNYRYLVTQDVNDCADFTAEQHELTVVITVDACLAQYSTDMYQRPESTFYNRMMSSIYSIAYFAQVNVIFILLSQQ